ncbi:hypothetical protein TWF481_004397 [Arthrobotrys musiformis]|uniref:Uncharacterized protein n=1 Tax=Arthrobotrys musiformis TaxID=47236 RepID=A0AAV9WJG0_9PEZI
MRVFSGKLVASVLLAIHIKFGWVYSEKVIIPLRPSWRLFRAENKAYVDAISANFAYLAENQETRCPNHFPRDPRRPPEGPARSSLQVLMSALSAAHTLLRRLHADMVESARANPNEIPNILRSLRVTGFNSLQDLNAAVERLKGFVIQFVQTGLKINTFLEKTINVPMRLQGENEILKWLYAAQLIKAPEGTIPNVWRVIHAIELDIGKKDEFIASVEDMGTLLRTAANVWADQATAWSGSLALPAETNTILIDEGPWGRRSLVSVMTTVGAYFRCWLTPVESIARDLRKLKLPAEFQDNLQLQSRPETNVMTGEVAGWDWEQGTDAFPGLLRQDRPSGPSTQTDISDSGDGQVRINPSDLTVNFINFNPDAPMVEEPPNNAAQGGLAQGQGSPSSVFSASGDVGQIEEVGEVEELNFLAVNNQPQMEEEVDEDGGQFIGYE